MSSKDLTTFKATEIGAKGWPIRKPGIVSPRALSYTDCARLLFALKREAIDLCKLKFCVSQVEED